MIELLVISGNKFSLNNGIYELIIVDRADEPNVVNIL